MTRYSLDANALIEPWNKYYSMTLCPNYWDVMENLAKEGVIFCTEEVQRELDKTDDELKAWAKARPYLFRSVTNDVQLKLRAVLQRCPRLPTGGYPASIFDRLSHVLSA